MLSGVGVRWLVGCRTALRGATAAWPPPPQRRWAEGGPKAARQGANKGAKHGGKRVKAASSTTGMRMRSESMSSERLDALRARLPNAPLRVVFKVVVQYLSLNRRGLGVAEVLKWIVPYLVNHEEKVNSDQLQRLTTLCSAQRYYGKELMQYFNQRLVVLLPTLDKEAGFTLLNGVSRLGNVDKATADALVAYYMGKVAELSAEDCAMLLQALPRTQREACAAVFDAIAEVMVPLVPGLPSSTVGLLAAEYRRQAYPSPVLVEAFIHDIDARPDAYTVDTIIECVYCAIALRHTPEAYAKLAPRIVADLKDASNKTLQSVMSLQLKHRANGGTRAADLDVSDATAREWIRRGVRDASLSSLRTVLIGFDGEHSPHKAQLLRLVGDEVVRRFERCGSVVGLRPFVRQFGSVHREHHPALFDTAAAAFTSAMRGRAKSSEPFDVPAAVEVLEAFANVRHRHPGFVAATGDWVRAGIERIDDDAIASIVDSMESLACEDPRFYSAVAQECQRRLDATAAAA